MFGSFIGTQGFFNDAVAATVKDVKLSGAAFIYGLRLVNTTAAAAYLQFFNVPAASVTLGTTPAAWVVRLGANESVVVPFPIPISLGGSGLSIAGTTTPAGNTGAAISVSASYQ